jgi:hypothetical protein
MRQKPTRLLHEVFEKNLAVWTALEVGTGILLGKGRLQLQSGNGGKMGS